MDAPRLEKRGSFFKLIDTIASEIGELKQEMVQTDLILENESGSSGDRSLVNDMDNMYLEKDFKAFARDSGYDSFSQKLSVLDKLLHTHPVWLQLGLSEEETVSILQCQPPGSFVVRKSAKLQKKVLSLRLPSESGSCLKEFTIKESSYTFSLEGSGISFADLFRLIAFYCISRDVLPFTLKLPHAISVARTEGELEDIAQLGINFWTSPEARTAAPAVPPPVAPPCRRPAPPRPCLLEEGAQALRTRSPSELECAQSKGALCFVNPLFLQAHSQDSGGGGAGLRRQSTGRSRSPPPRPSLHSPRPSGGAKRQEASMPETGRKPAPVPPPRLKKQASSAGDWDGGSPAPRGVAGASCRSEPPPPVQPNRGGGRQLQRLSDMSISTSSSDSLELERRVPLFCYEPDSSFEDYEGDPESDPEGMPPPLKPRKKRSSSLALPRAVKAQLLKVSGVFTSLLTPERRTVRRLADMARDKGTYFGCLVQDYVSFLRENRDCHVSSTDLLQTVRQFMTQVKNYLAQSSELDPPIESLIPEDQIDAVLEKAMHKCILKPLKSHIETMLKEFHVSDGSWKQLKENLQLVRQRTPQELGVCAPTPDTLDMEKIKARFLTMQKTYSPDKKVRLLLRVCKLIYTCMEHNSGRMYGADDFLPVLTYVVAQCDMLELDIEIEYMMELLDPVLLHGEGGYYLTSAYGALSLIKNFQEEQAARLLSSEARHTLRQWHKRRTTNRTVPSVDDFQNYLRVALQEVESGCTGKTLLVRPYTTTEDVCQICAEKFKVPDPENYGLFLYIDETWQQLTEDTYPQKIKAELHSRPQPQVFHFVYRRIRSDHPGIVFIHEDNDSSNDYFPS
ncbi:ras and Rab interactor 2 isoform X2 [Rhinatrema bivittatum]|nr:ras and Rab interactor 2 isoform X2 [Rhinatrema bivittatum]XP_029449631.1 ras and Rab interactor 2 isoform X2 [Rhinatrema bivittatum]